MKLLEFLVNGQSAVCKSVERLLPATLTTDGNRHFLDAVVPAFLCSGARVVDVGGGRSPVLSLQAKSQMTLTVEGFDIDDEALRSAPPGYYDTITCSDIQTFAGGRSTADVVICQALLEHVPDVRKALSAIATMLRPGGVALLFVPCGDAIFARLNMLLPHALKRRILFALMPQARAGQGHPAYYDQCTPCRLTEVANGVGLEVIAEHLYYRSAYFFWCAPLYLVWRIWSLCRYISTPRSAAETFTLVVRKTA